MINGIENLEKMIKAGKGKKALLAEVAKIKEDNFGGGWSLDDIIYGCDGAKGHTEPKVSRSTARVIADKIESDHDPNFGITWDTIEDLLENHVLEKEEYD